MLSYTKARKMRMERGKGWSQLAVARRLGYRSSSDLCRWELTGQGLTKDKIARLEAMLMPPHEAPRVEAPANGASKVWLTCPTTGERIKAHVLIALTDVAGELAWGFTCPVCGERHFSTLATKARFNGASNNGGK